MINPRIGDLIDNNEQDEFDEFNIQIERFDRFFAGKNPLGGEDRMNGCKETIRLYETPKFKNVGLVWKGLRPLVHFDEAIKFPEGNSMT